MPPLPLTSVSGPVPAILKAPTREIFPSTDSSPRVIPPLPVLIRPTSTVDSSSVPAVPLVKTPNSVTVLADRARNVTVPPPLLIGDVMVSWSDANLALPPEVAIPTVVFVPTVTEPTVNGTALATSRLPVMAAAIVFTLLPGSPTTNVPLPINRKPLAVIGAPVFWLNPAPAAVTLTDAVVSAFTALFTAIAPVALKEMALPPDTTPLTPSSASMVKSAPMPVP